MELRYRVQRLVAITSFPDDLHIWQSLEETSQRLTHEIEVFDEKHAHR
jgi:hypothetical protein